MQVEFRCSGHPNISATHRKTLELTRDPDLTPRGTCIVGVAGDWDGAALRALRGRIRVALIAGPHTDTFEAEVAPSPTTSTLVFRRGPDIADRTFAHYATASAATLDRRLVAELRSGDAVLEVRIEQQPSPATGVLYVVALPIGNFDDLTPRARRSIELADVVLAENTRRFRVLTREADVTYRTLLSYYDANEDARAAEALELLRHGSRVALVSDAGAPLVSDPGLRLVRHAVEHGIRVIPVPGPSAPIVALMAAGIATDQFLFAGFLPRRRDQRRRRLGALAGHPGAVVLFEAPHRLADSLADLAELLPGRGLFVGRELTKIHEELTHTTTDEAVGLLADLEPRGEYTLVVGPPPVAPVPDTARDASLSRLVAALRDHVSTKVLASALSEATGLTRRAAYDMALGKGVDDDS